MIFQVFRTDFLVSLFINLKYMKSNSIFGLVCMTLSILLLLLDVCSIMVAWLKAKKIEMIWQEILNEKVLSGKKTV